MSTLGWVGCAESELRSSAVPKDGRCGYSANALADLMMVAILGRPEGRPLPPNSRKRSTA